MNEEERFDWMKECERLKSINADLLKALQALSNWPSKSMCFDGETSKGLEENMANARRFAREAVAKAGRGIK